MGEGANGHAESRRTWPGWNRRLPCSPRLVARKINNLDSVLASATKCYSLRRTRGLYLESEVDANTTFQTDKAMPQNGV